MQKATKGIMLPSSPVSSFVSDHSEHSEFACPSCGSNKLRRLPRFGFLQQKVFPIFGFFPWECPICRQTRLYRKRGKRVRRHSSDK